MHLLKYGITNISCDGLVEHGIEGLIVLNGAIVGTSGKCVRSVGGVDWLIFGDNIVIGISSCGDGEDAMR